MTQPWTPSPNPGGRNRELVSVALAEWMAAQHIGGLQAVQPTPRGPARVDWEEYAVGVGGPRCQVVLSIPRASEARVAGVGPTNAGGKLAHYEVTAEVYYLGGEPVNWQAAVFDFYRIVDALKDCLRGSGRDLQRPDVILQVGEWPREVSISDELDEPIDAEGGVYITGRLFFQVSQYMQQQP